MSKSVFRVSSVVLVAVLVFVFTACGDDDDDYGSPSQPAGGSVPAAPDPVLADTGSTRNDWSFDVVETPAGPIECMTNEIDGRTKTATGGSSCNWELFNRTRTDGNRVSADNETSPDRYHRPGR